MATGAEATERIAEAVGLLPATVFRIARILREADTSFWPEAGKGGGKAAVHVRPPHLVNLAVALAVRDPLLAVKAIPAYRKLVPHTAYQHALPPDDVGLTGEFLTAHNMFNGTRALGAELERLIELLTEGDSAPLLENAGLYAEFFFEPRVPRVGIGYHQFDLQDDARMRTVKLTYRKPNIPPGLSRELDLYRDLLPQRSIPRTATIFASVFSTMAELWAHTKQHHAITTVRQRRRSTILTRE